MTRRVTREQITEEPQEVALGETIIYTYDVSWKVSDTRWASRWDIYLTMNKAIKNRVSAGPPLLAPPDPHDAHALLTRREDHGTRTDFWPIISHSSSSCMYSTNPFGPFWVEI